MERKLIKFGKASYMTILPKKWIGSLGLKEGQNLNIEYKENILTISPSEIKIPEKIKKIEFSKDEYPKLLRNKIITAYLNGFTTINISFEEIPTKKQLSMVNEAIKRCTGLSITNQVEKSLVIRDLLDESKINDINEQLKTIKIHIRNCFYALEEDILAKSNFDSANSVELATNSLYLGIRSSAIIKKQRQYSYFLVVNNLLTILQTMYYIAHLNSKKEWVDEIKKIKELYDKVFLILINQDTKRLKEVNRLRKNLKSDYKKLMQSKDSNAALFGEYCRRISYLLGLIAELELE